MVKTLIFALVSMFTVGLMENIKSPLYPLLLKHFALSASQAQFYFSLSSLFSFIATLLSFYWYPRFKDILGTQVGVLILGVGASGFYFFWQQNNLLGFWISNCFYGVGIGILSITLNTTIANSSIIRKREALSAVHSMYGLASLVAPLYLLLFTQVEYSYFFLIILAIFSFLLGYKIPKSSSVKSASVILLNKQSLLIGCVLGVYVSAEVLISSRLVNYLIVHSSFTFEQSAMYLSLFFLLLLIGRVSFSLTRLSCPNFIIMQISLIVSIILVALGVWLHPIGLSLSALSMSVFYPTFIGHLDEIYQSRSKEVIPVAINSIGLLLFFFHWSYGVIEQYSNLNMMLLPLSLLFISLILLCSSYRHTKNC